MKKHYVIGIVFIILVLSGFTIYNTMQVNQQNESQMREITRQIDEEVKIRLQQEITEHEFNVKNLKAKIVQLENQKLEISGFKLLRSKATKEKEVAEISNAIKLFEDKWFLETEKLNQKREEIKNY